MQYKKIIFIIISITVFNSSISFSQDDIIKNYHLTHKLSPAEKELMKNCSKDFYETDPPAGEVRNIAEWEPMESVLIAYDGGFGIPYSLIAEMSEDCNITTIVSGSSEETTVRNIYSSNSVNLDHCNFVYQDPDSWWTRDYSPWYIAVDDSEVAIINFPYNRPRPNDNDVPILMADSLNIDLYGMDVTHTGGNYMCDGYGIAASTDLVWDEESQTPEQINTKMLNYLGIETYHVTADPLDDYIKHIDCWGKFLDVDKILITQVPATDYRYDDYEALATYFSQENCYWGYPYEVIRVQAATYYDYDVNPYTNSLILNDKVFVPQTGSSLDDDAIATYETAMPAYEIIGVYSSGWYNTDALHCRTHGVADREMLYIKHYPLYGDLSFQENFTIEADVVSYGGSIITAGFPKLFCKQNGGTWEETVMTNTGGNTYTASISGLSGNNEVEYYIYAENENNKTESHPLIGSGDPHMFSYSDGSVAVNEVKQNKEAKIFPNPNSGRFTLQTSLNSGFLHIFNINGQEVYSSELSSSLNTIDISNLTSGIYLIKIENENGIYYEKLIIN
ncbi:MAG: agmatine deiminase family protein [Bacteroidales bacterium]|nr:agmatine deiminase family protein [Bacteroidales bacterium]